MISVKFDNRNVQTPNEELLRAQGWHISSTVGPYCTAWRNCQEVLFIWKNGTWQRLDNPLARH
jgi:hypothetical protein